jgi:hypothetical protein
MKFISLLLLSVLILTGCAPTPYGDANQSVFGGYRKEAAPGNLVKISFLGNGYTKPALAQEYALRYAAQVAEEVKAPYFAVYQTLSDAASNHKTQAPVVYTQENMPTAYFYVAYHQKKEAGDLSPATILNRYKK